VAARRREHDTISGVRLRRRDLAPQDVELVAQDQQLDVLDIQATAIAHQCARQRPEREVRRQKATPATVSVLAQTRRDMTIGALQPFTLLTRTS
jgi:hypothetical protein